MDLKISRPRKRHPRTETQRIKWWNLKDRKEIFFASVAPSALPHPTRSVEEMWSSTSSVIRLTAENTLGKTTLGGRTPDVWQTSVTVPVWKGKGNIAVCTSYRPIRLLCHTMKVFECVLEARLRKIVSVSLNQCGFVKDCSTVDAIHAVRILLEKHREKNHSVHLAFLDLEKGFDRVPHGL
ncbi:hypothetical protein RB195_006614 [Necator americanus]|uniref:Reverse transcriptase domain-containing protein n=1 Tax=Necator americanus TaxID=51031 RepID=A0ABR1BWF1_NECAM